MEGDTTAVKIIDAHLHVGDNPYFNEIAGLAGHVNTVEHLEEQFRRLEIVHGVVMVGDGSLELEDRQYPALLSYCVGMRSEWLAPHRLRHTLDMAEQHLLEENCVGVKLYPGYEEFSVGDALCDPLYELVLRYHKPVAVHTGYTAQGDTSPWCHPGTVGEAASRWPQVQFVMCHFGNPWIADAAQVLRRNSNVAADLSGILEGKAESLDALLKRLQPFIRTLRRALGELDDYSRILYGTDWPLANLADYIGFVEHLIPPEHHQAVFFENARRIYSLPV